MTVVEAVGDVVVVVVEEVEGRVVVVEVVDEVEGRVVVVLVVVVDEVLGRVVVVLVSVVDVVEDVVDVVVLDVVLVVVLVVVVVEEVVGQVSPNTTKSGSAVVVKVLSRIPKMTRSSCNAGQTIEVTSQFTPSILAALARVPTAPVD